MPSAQLSPASSEWVEKGKDSGESKRPNMPTILEAVCASTREERMTPGEDGKPSEANRTCAKALWTVMEKWADHAESVYREVDECRDFVAGRHYSYYSGALNLRVLAPEKSNVLRLSMNYLDGFVDRVVSQVLAAPPIIKCLAGDSDVVDQAASEAADDIVDWLQLRDELAADPENVARNAEIDGACWVHEEYDTSAGPTVETGRWNVFGADGALLPSPTPETGPQGDFHRDIFMPRQVVPDPSASHPFQGSGIFLRPRTSRFEFERRFGKDTSDDTPAQSDERTNRVAALGRGKTSSGDTMPAGEDPAARDEVEPVILYAPKCEDYPRGFRIIFTKDRVVEDVDNPRYPTDEELARGETEPNPCKEPPWPVFPFIRKFRPQSPFGLSAVTKCIHPQKAINGIASVSVQHIGQLGRPKIVLPNDLAQEWTDQIQVFKMNKRDMPLYSPKIVNPPPMSQDNIVHWREHRGAMLEFMGLNDPAVGQSENADDSGYKVRLQQQAASAAVEQVRKRYNDMWAEIRRYDLFLWRRHADTKRTIEIIGENQRTVLRAFDRTAILPNTHVRCIHDAAVPRNPQDLMTWMMQFMKTGVMQLPPDQKQEMFQVLRLQDLKSFQQRNQGDRMRAERQILRIKEGRDPGEISDVDDHLVQANVLGEWIKSDEFETIVEKEATAATQPGAPPSAVPGASMSPTYDRAIGLWRKHKDAYVAQTQAAMPPPIVKVEGTMTKDQVATSLGQPAASEPQAAPA